MSNWETKEFKLSQLDDILLVGLNSNLTGLDFYFRLFSN